MPAVTYRGAADVPHCSGMVRSGHSLNVRVNGIGVSRQGDNNTPHLLPCGPICCGHARPISTGSLTVRVNGRGCGRVGDGISGCTSVAQGSPNVFAGGGQASSDPYEDTIESSMVGPDHESVAHIPQPSMLAGL